MAIFIIYLIVLYVLICNLPAFKWQNICTHWLSRVFQFHCRPTLLISIDTIPTQQMFQHFWHFKKKYFGSVMHTTFSVMQKVALGKINPFFERKGSELLVVCWPLLAVKCPPNHSLAPPPQQNKGKKLN